MSTDAPQQFIRPPLDCADAVTALEASALGALEPEEQRAVAAHVARCSSCRAALARLEEAVDALSAAIVPVEPPPSLRQSLMAEIARAGDESARQFERRRAGAPAPWRRAAFALAIAATLLLAGLGVASVSLIHTRTARDAALADRRDVAEYLRHGGTMAALTPTPGNAGGAEGNLIVAPDQPRALLVVAGLASANDGSDYRVWVERAGRRTWLAKIEVGADGTGYLLVAAPEPLTTYDRIGIAWEAPGQSARDVLTAPIPSHGV
jgi:anti-sigma factor RsiW